MKISISLSDEDLEFIDAYGRRATGARSRSAVIRAALDALRREALPDAYDQAWREWERESEAWDRAVGDGL